MITVGIVQARMSSSRLPGKVLRQILGKPMLQHVMRAVSLAKTLDTVLIASSNQASDNPVEVFAKTNHWGCFRGSLKNVAQRFLDAAHSVQASRIVRICGDSPLIDHRVIDRAVDLFDESDAKIVSNVRPRTFPFGCSVEVFDTSTLETILQPSSADDRCSNTEDSDSELTETDLEHVTPAIYRRFASKVKNLTNKIDLSQLRLTVDTPEDFERISDLMNALNGDPNDWEIEKLAAWIALRRGVAA